MNNDVSKEYLQSLAGKLMFKLSDKEAETLQEEFKIVLKQMDLIGEIDHINDYTPMTFPYVTYEYELRADEAEESLSFDDILKNSKGVRGNEIKVPKVVD